MKIKITLLLSVLIGGAVSGAAQRLASERIGDYVVPDDVLIAIVKAEDRRDVAPVIPMLSNVNSATRYRAALAAGRIGDAKAIQALTPLLTDSSIEVRAMAAFAIGEIESIDGAEAILRTLAGSAPGQRVVARAVEAAGKIAAANARDERSKQLGEAVLTVLDEQDRKGSGQDKETILLGITAALRARPPEADFIVARFLTSLDARIRADAANALGRARAKNANAALRTMLLTDDDAVARANAARALGAAEDQASADLLVNAAVEDEDSRVRVSAIRSLIPLRDAKANERLLARGDEVLEIARKASKPGYFPIEKNEMLELATAIGRLFAGTANEKALRLLSEYRRVDRFSSPETEIAFATVSADRYLNEFNTHNSGLADWRVTSALAQGLGSLATSTDAGVKGRASAALASLIAKFSAVSLKDRSEMVKALPDLHRANAAFKPSDLDATLRALLDHNDVLVRTTAATLLGAQPKSSANVEALSKAFARAMENDTKSDDAQIALLNALNRIDKKASANVFVSALGSHNHLVRKRAVDILSADAELQRDFPDIAGELERFRKSGRDKVLEYQVGGKTRLGQVLNSDVDYRRALSRRNGSTRAVFTTQKGVFTIRLNGQDAPLTVDNFIRLARARYFNGASVHRVVPNFVMQDGDPTGSGSGGPGHTIRCEINPVEYGRGAVGMALAGKDTGGSQWFVTHAPQPHLDGGYTVFGQVDEKDMKVVDAIVRGDKLISVRIIEGRSPARR